MEIIEVIWRTSAAFVLFMLIAKMLGRTTLAQMTMHDFIAAVTLGGITANLAFNVKLSFRDIAVSLVLFGLISFLTTYLSLKNRKAREWLSGRPTVVIEDGKLLERNMQKQKLSLDNLNESLREKDIFDIDEVQYAILEADGHVSVLKKPHYRSATKQDVQAITPSMSQIPIELIMDGKIIDRNLHENNISKNWIMNEVSKRGVDLSDVFYAVKGTNGQLYVDLNEDQIRSPIDEE